MPPADTSIVLPRPARAAPSWRADLWRRMRRLFPLKLIGTTAYVWLFFIGYFHLLSHPAYPVAMMPLTALDHGMPFMPQALYAYLTLWVYVGVAPGLQLTFRDLLAYGLWVAALLVAGLGLFYFWPTQVPPLNIDVSAYPGFAALKGVDATGNACPSMHVAIAIFTAIRTEDVLRGVAAPVWLRAVNIGWFIAIAFSTVAIRQHVVLDVVAGAALGIAFALASLRWRPNVSFEHADQTPTP